MIPFSSKFISASDFQDGLFYRHAPAGDAPLVLLLHGHTQSSDMWAPLANQLAEDGFGVLAVDLPGLGRSTVEGPYEKYAQASILQKLVLGLNTSNSSVHLIGHDLGAFVAYAYAAQFAGPADTLTLLDAAVPGIGIWPMLLMQPRTWHFGFYGRFAEQLVSGRERIYLDRFWDEFSVDPSVFTETMRDHYAEFYRKPGALERALSQFSTFEADALDNESFAKSKLTIPVLGLGGEHSLGPMMGDHLSLIADNVQTNSVRGAGHWLMEEQPDQTIGFIHTFLAKSI